MKKTWIFTTFLILILCTVCITLLPIEAEAASIKINTNITSIGLLTYESLSIDCLEELYCGFELSKGGSVICQRDDFAKNITIRSSDFSAGEGTYRLRVYVQGYDYIHYGMNGYKRVPYGPKKYTTFTIYVHSKHIRDNGTITKQPTCTRMGQKVYSCTICGKEMVVETLGETPHSYGSCIKVDESDHKYSCSVCYKSKYASHTWDSGKVTTQPTCVKEGVKTYTCSGCKTTKTEVVAKSTEHTYGQWIKVDESTHKRVCSNCPQEETGSHIWDDGILTKQPTCVQEGTRGYTCATCQGTKIEMLPKTTWHDYGVWTMLDEDTHQHICNNCSETESDYHTWDDGKITTQPTCVKEGVKTYTCVVCRGTKAEMLPKTTWHNYGSWTMVNEDIHQHICNNCPETESAPHGWDDGEITKQPTCAEDGVKTYTCAVCKGTKKESIEKLPHRWNNGIITQQPTCGEEGVRTYTCAACEENRTESIETLPHSWDSGRITMQPTCGEDGIKTFTCNNCGGNRTERVAKTGDHQYGKWIQGDAQYHKRVCDTCGDEKTQSHNFGTSEITKEATCMQEGIRAQTCVICREIKETIIPITDHKLETLPGISATCVEKGLTAGQQCAYCQEIITAQKEISAKGHEWQEATCKTAKSCLVCGQVNGKPLGHSYGNWVQTYAPSVHQVGREERFCSNCNDIEQRELPKLELDPTEQEGTESGRQPQNNSGMTIILEVAIIIGAICVCGAVFLVVFKKKK